MKLLLIIKWQMTAPRFTTCKTWLGVPGMVGDWLGCACFASTTTVPSGPSWGVTVFVTHPTNRERLVQCTGWISISDPSDPCSECFHNPNWSVLSWHFCEPWSGQGSYLGGLKWSIQNSNW
jgi:hypothetical protein